MGLTVLVVAGLAYWDAIRESETALRELADVQTATARALGLAVDSLRAAGSGGDAQVKTILGRIERAGSTRLFLHDPSEATLRSIDDGVGAPISSARIIEATRRHEG